jgi:cyclopropane-fatty-acyl-phospholipid synthase
VGEPYWSDYFATLRRCLKPGAKAVVQTITIDDALFERYRRGTDFIQQYIFPGGMLPSPSRFEDCARAAGLGVSDRFAFGTDYAHTLALWRKAFMAQLPQITAQGFDARFARIWEFYLAYCEAGFAQGNTDVMQFTLSAPQ